MISNVAARGRKAEAQGVVVMHWAKEGVLYTQDKQFPLLSLGMTGISPPCLLGVAILGRWEAPSCWRLGGCLEDTAGGAHLVLNSSGIHCRSCCCLEQPGE